MFGRHIRPSELLIRRIVESFEASYSLHHQRTSIRGTARSAENIAAVQASDDKSSLTSIRRRAQQYYGLILRYP